MSAPMAMAFTVEHWLMFALAAAAVGLEAWALADVLRRPQADFVRAGGRDKNFWLMLTGIALAVGLMGLLLGGGGLGLFGFAAACVASVYLAGPRERMGARL